MNFMAQAANQHMASWSLWEKRAQDVTATLRQRHCPKKPFIGQKAQLIHKKKIESHWHGHFLCIEAFLIPKRESRA
jgi:hypothetical protein